jgi:hypothetical protein
MAHHRKPPQDHSTVADTPFEMLVWSAPAGLVGGNRSRRDHPRDIEASVPALPIDPAPTLRAE